MCLFKNVDTLISTTSLTMQILGKILSLHWVILILIPWRVFGLHLVLIMQPLYYLSSATFLSFSPPPPPPSTELMFTW